MIGCVTLVLRGACINDLNVASTVILLRLTIQVFRLIAFLI